MLATGFDISGALPRTPEAHAWECSGASSGSVRCFARAAPYACQSSQRSRWLPRGGSRACPRPPGLDAAEGHGRAVSSDPRAPELPRHATGLRAGTTPANRPQPFAVSESCPQPTQRRLCGACWDGPPGPDSASEPQKQFMLRRATTPVKSGSAQTLHRRHTGGSCCCGHRGETSSRCVFVGGVTLVR
jgi:hypothetical protein